MRSHSGNVRELPSFMFDLETKLKTQHHVQPVCDDNLKFACRKEFLYHAATISPECAAAARALSHGPATPIATAPPAAKLKIYERGKPPPGL